ncbi:MAG: hypothetical protein WCA38_19310 [Candidatus Acidiferrales bacterium]
MEKPNLEGGAKFGEDLTLVVVLPALNPMRRERNEGAVFVVRAGAGKTFDLILRFSASG